MEQTTAPQPEKQTKPKANRILAVLSLLTIIAFIIIFVLIGMSQRTEKPKDIAPKLDAVTNPQGIEAILGFSVLNPTVTVGKPLTVDMEIQTLDDKVISKGTITVKYDPTIISSIKLKPISGSTGILPQETVFSKIQYNPNNVMFTFTIPTGNPIKGKGRIAELTFTPSSPSKEGVAKISYDLSHSTISSSDKKLRAAVSDLDFTYNLAN